jgi:hypothetical protein
MDESKGGVYRVGNDQIQPDDQTAKGFTLRTFSNEQIEEFLEQDELNDAALAIVRRIEEAIKKRKLDE